MSANVRVRSVAETLSRSYVICGVACTVTASSKLVSWVDETFGAYRVEVTKGPTYAIEVAGDHTAFLLTDSTGICVRCADESEAVYLTLERLARRVTGELARRDVYAVHASSLVYNEEALIIPGKSRAGKTTLALALVSRGLRILSDEFALSAPDGRTILPYRRGLHIRPGTPELVGELAFLSRRPHHPLSGGFQWTLPPEELERVFPSCLAEPAPLRHIVLLEPRSSDRAVGVLEPVSSGVAAMELVRSTTAAADDFAGALERMTRLVNRARCVRLRPARLESSIELILGWLARRDD